MMPTVLVTAIGTVTATAIVTELKATGKYHIIGADINREYEIATSRDVDEFYSFPPISDMEGYIQFVLKFCKEHHVEYYYAVLDKEVVGVTRRRADFTAIGTKLCMVNYEFAERCHYKNEFSLWIQANLPEIYIQTYKAISELSEEDFPVFIKPTEGVASSGCKKINTMNALKENVPEDKFNSEILVQEYVQGMNITVDLVRNRKTGQQAQIQRRELLRNGNGCGIAVEIFFDEHLQRICDDLMAKLDLDGVANAEFFYDGTNYKIIEINPRFSAGSRYSCMAGINTVLNARCIADGEECTFGTVSVGKHYAERYEAYQMD